MKNNTVSDIYCLTSQTEEAKDGRNSQDQLFSVKGNASLRLPRHRDSPYSSVFPPGCMGNKQFVDIDALNRMAKRQERLSYDEQERAMNILSKIHRGRKALRAKLESKDDNNSTTSSSSSSRNQNGSDIPVRYRLTVRRSQPDMSDFDYLLELIKSKEGIPEQVDQHGDDGTVLTMVEFRFMSGILMKENAMRFFTSRLRGGSSPSMICRNPITGNGLEENFRIARKRGFDSVVKFMADKSDNDLEKRVALKESNK